jgi:hypothetical protein
MTPMPREGGSEERAPAVAIDGAIMISFLLSDGWLERRMNTLNGAVARRLK